MEKNDNKKIKLLMLTQRIDIDDDLLGFMHGWTAKLAGYCEKITVIALGAGKYDLPENVKLFSLGKKLANSKWPIANRARYTVNFYKYIWRYRNEYDYVFVHMNKEYMVLGGLLWRLWGKKTALWYNHRYGNMWGKLAGALANIIFFTSPFSFFSKNKKAKQMPAGIDTEKFQVSSSKFHIIFRKDLAGQKTRCFAKGGKDTGRSRD